MYIRVVHYTLRILYSVLLSDFDKIDSFVHARFERGFFSLGGEASTENAIKAITGCLNR